MPAQYFHLLRRQARHADLRPLIVMTPNSLLRLPEAASRPDELSSGAFASVLDDPGVADDAAAGVTRVILCSGKVYYDLTASEERAEHPELAIVRTERLYPFPTEDLERVMARYPAVERITWVQEEPRNMGARKFVLPRSGTWCRSASRLATSAGRSARGRQRATRRRIRPSRRESSTRR